MGAHAAGVKLINMWNIEHKLNEKKYLFWLSVVVAPVSMSSYFWQDRPDIDQVNALLVWFILPIGCCFNLHRYSRGKSFWIGLVRSSETNTAGNVALAIVTFLFCLGFPIFIA